MYYRKPDEDNDSYQPTMAFSRFRKFYDLAPERKDKRDAIALQVFCEDMEQVIRAKREEAIANAEAEQNKIMQRLEGERRNT